MAEKPNSLRFRQQDGDGKRMNRRVWKLWESGRRVFADHHSQTAIKLNASSVNFDSG